MMPKSVSQSGAVCRRHLCTCICASQPLQACSQPHQASPDRVLPAREVRAQRLVEVGLSGAHDLVELELLTVWALAVCEAPAVEVAAHHLLGRLEGCLEGV